MEIAPPKKKNHFPLSNHLFMNKLYCHPNVALSWQISEKSGNCRSRPFNRDRHYPPTVPHQLYPHSLVELKRGYSYQYENKLSFMFAVIVFARFSDIVLSRSLMTFTNSYMFSALAIIKGICTPPITIFIQAAV